MLPNGTTSKVLTRVGRVYADVESRDDDRVIACLKYYIHKYLFAIKLLNVLKDWR